MNMERMAEAHVSMATEVWVPQAVIRVTSQGLCLCVSPGISDWSLFWNRHETDERLILLPVML
jgi:hypothetical protein